MKIPGTLNIAVPTDWTPQQAKAVVEILDELSTTIWDLYEDDITTAVEDEQAQILKAIRGDNESV